MPKPQSKPLHDPLSKKVDQESRIEVKNTTCYMCACRCGIRVTLRDGEIRFIEGNPDHPINKGVICAKGSSGLMKQYSPARLTKPLLRKEGSERGDNEFEEISWDRPSESWRSAWATARHRPEEIRPVHRPRPDAGPDRPVRQAVRHPQLRRPRRLLLREHGRRHDLHHRRLVLGVWRPGPGARQAVRDDRNGRGPPLQSAEGGNLQVQAQGRQVHFHQPGAHGLFRHRRRVDTDQARHRRGPAAGADQPDHSPGPV